MAVKPHQDAPWRDMANKGKDNSTYTEGGAAHAKLTRMKFGPLVKSLRSKGLSKVAK